MRVLLVTEKCGPAKPLRDGGSRLVESLQREFGERLAIAQFGEEADASARWHFPYPRKEQNRFLARVVNGGWIAECVRGIAKDFTDVIFIHISMQFGFADRPLVGRRTWTFPMFLTPSYVASGEEVPTEYTRAELLTLASAEHVFTPSRLELCQLVDFYGVPRERIRVIPRGVDTRCFQPTVRLYEGNLRLCSIGTIKRQKNTVGLIHFFSEVRRRHPGATLRILGAVQDSRYEKEVREAIAVHSLETSVEFLGHVAPDRLAAALADEHLHVSASICETFGRAIFESLACGIPNVARAKGNAAAEHLACVPYAGFLDDTSAALDAVDTFTADLSRRSGLASEVGELFDDSILARLLAAEIEGGTLLGISDFDGTIYHKTDPGRTRRCVEAFRKFPARVVCSGRSVADLVEALDALELSVDWIIGCSGAVVADGRGKTAWCVELSEEDVETITRHLPDAVPMMADGRVVQLRASLGPATPAGFRTESYQDFVYVSGWEASKLRSVVRLLRHINWPGRVRAFGDGRYDEPLISFFDGTWIQNSQSLIASRSGDLRAESVSYA